MSNDRHYILTLSCQDTTGIVAAVTQCIATHKGWITEAHQHGDPIANWFFMRVMIRANSLDLSLEKFKAVFAPLAAKFNMQWQLSDTAHPKRVVVLVSKHDHCLADILYRWQSHDLPMELTAVISNHPDLETMVTPYKLPYHTLNMSLDNKTQAFSELENLFTQYNPDVIVLARFMQILPPDMCSKYAGQLINIHHSFLPSFIGADPYLQAFKRGVKLIGATCHYVTNELDEGPIIEQDIARIQHDYSLAEIKRLGKDIEKTVLSRGLRYHLEDKVLLHHNKTIVFA